jgi:hypothetical protein
MSALQQFVLHHGDAIVRELILSTVVVAILYGALFLPRLSAKSRFSIALLALAKFVVPATGVRCRP